MRRVVAVILLVAFVMNCGVGVRQKTEWESIENRRRYIAEARKYAGTEIVVDAEKRDMVDMFPGIKDFKEAQFVGTSGGGYDVEIVTETGKLRSVNEDPYGMAILLDYLDNYEEIRRTAGAFNTKWGILDHDTLGAPITRSEANRYTDPGKALTKGCSWGCIAAGVAGLGIGAIAVAETKDAGESGADMGVGIGIMVAGALATVLAVVIAGSSVGCLTGRDVYKQDTRKAVEKIKEQRKPRVVE